MNNILMNTETTKDILDDRKTQTRRALKLNDSQKETFDELYKNSNAFKIMSMETSYSKPKYKKGEIVSVREPAKIIHTFLDSKNNAKRTMKYKFLSDGKDFNLEIPNRFIDVFVENGNFRVVYPKWLDECQGIPNGCIKEMARIFLKIIDVRVERLHDITYEDIVAEGFDVTLHNGTKGQLKKEACKWWTNLWNRTAPKVYKWEDNPYVFVYEFERINRDGSKL